MTGHSYIVYGPLANRTTGVIYEGSPDYPDKDRVWDICERYGAIVPYTAPTAIRTFMKWGLEHVWWQTETGMIMITPLPGATTTRPGSAARPFPGVDTAVYDENGDEVAPGGRGNLVLRRPWPAMLRGLFKEPERYKEAYWSRYPGIYFVGDGARIDEGGQFRLLGRIDDVIKRLGPPPLND